MATDDFLRGSIERGRPGTPMSAWSTDAGGPLDDAVIDEIMDYLRTFRRSPPAVLDHHAVARGDVNAGRQVYLERCAECHGPAGEGVTAPALGNPVFLDLASDAFIASSIAEGRPGTAMEAFGGELDNRTIANLTVFIRTLGRPQHRDPHHGHNHGQDPHGHDHHGHNHDHPHEDPAGGVDVWADLEDADIPVHPSGPPARFQPNEGGYIPVATLRRELARGARLVLIDARATSDWLAGHIPGSLPVPFYAEAMAIERIPNDDTWVIVYCGCPHAAADRVATQLRNSGWDNVAVVDEGYFGWVEAGWPVVVGPERE
jgi:cytochrome c oxidase cbb3-type subunit 3/ubiquinol-cytochrome c reductase cytochrome c subunit